MIWWCYPYRLVILHFISFNHRINPEFVPCKSGIKIKYFHKKASRSTNTREKQTNCWKCKSLKTINIISFPTQQHNITYNWLFYYPFNWYRFCLNYVKNKRPTAQTQKSILMRQNILQRRDNNSTYWGSWKNKRHPSLTKGGKY